MVAETAYSRSRNSKELCGYMHALDHTYVDVLCRHAGSGPFARFTYWTEFLILPFV